MKPKLYREDPSHLIEALFVDDEAYRKALDGMVIVCVDIVPIDRDRKLFYLVRRNSRPMRGSWWWIGGRVHAGETSAQAATRSFRRETSLELTGERLQFLCMNRYMFKDREQEPVTRGTDGLAYTFCVELTEEEIHRASASLDPNEYGSDNDLEAFDAERVRTTQLHPAIRDLYAQVFEKTGDT